MEGIVVRRPETLRWILTLGMAASCFISFSISFASAGEAILLSLLMALVGAGAGFVAVSLFRTPARAIMFDGERLVDDSGLELCTLDDIVSVDRGFAMWKPSNGFALTLKSGKPAGWSPGLWWRHGAKIGVGGATPGRSARNMADALTAALAQRMMAAQADG